MRRHWRGQAKQGPKREEEEVEDRRNACKMILVSMS